MSRGRLPDSRVNRVYGTPGGETDIRRTPMSNVRSAESDFDFSKVHAAFIARAFMSDSLADLFFAAVAAR